MVTLAEFRPDLEAVDGPFECDKPEVMGTNVISLSAVAPSRAEERVSIVLMVDTLGNVLHYAERRGAAINPDTRGMTPAQVGAAVQAAALASRSTLISADFPTKRASTSNRGGNLPNVTAAASADEIMHSDILGHPSDRAARILEQCSATVRRAPNSLP